MKIISTRDRVILESDELQAVLKDYIETTLKRKVAGEVLFQKENGGGALSAHVHLEPESRDPFTTPVQPPNA